MDPCTVRVETAEVRRRWRRTRWAWRATTPAGVLTGAARFVDEHEAFDAGMRAVIAFTANTTGRPPARITTGAFTWRS